MSQNQEPKIYVPGSCKQVSEKLLKLNLPAADVIKLIQEHQSNGWIAFAISPRREVGPKGQTHTVWVDKWQPGQKQSAPSEPLNREQHWKKHGTLPPAQPKPEGDEVPF